MKIQLSGSKSFTLIYFLNKQSLLEVEKSREVLEGLRGEEGLEQPGEQKRIMQRLSYLVRSCPCPFSAVLPRNTSPVHIN